MLGDVPACRYFRYVSSDKGHVFLAEMRAYDTAGHELAGEIIGTEGSWDDNGFDKYKVFDGNYLTFFDAPATAGCWVGLAFDRKEQIGEIKYLPKNDDNNINEGEEYELFYYGQDWISLGRRTGGGKQELIYDNVPQNALLWLRNYTKGREERIFIYENGKQVFY